MTHTPTLQEKLAFLSGSIEHSDTDCKIEDCALCEVENEFYEEW